MAGMLVMLFAGCILWIEMSLCMTGILSPAVLWRTDAFLPWKTREVLLQNWFCHISVRSFPSSMELLLKLGMYPWLFGWSCVGNWVRDFYILIMPSNYVLLVTSSCPKRILKWMKGSLTPHLCGGILSVIIFRMAISWEHSVCID